MERANKEQVVLNLKDRFNSATTVVVSHYRGLNVDEMSSFRKSARDAGASVQVAKNTLASLAANDTKFDGLVELFKGPTALTSSDDAVAAAKVVVDFAKENETLIILGGSFNGELLDEAGVKALAKTPSLDESRAKLVGLFTAPASQLARLVSSPAGKLARVFSARGSQEA